MIDERLLVEKFRESLITGRESFSVDSILDVISELPVYDVWIPTDIEEPKDEYLECFVTARMKTWTDPKFSFTTKAVWIKDGWYWKNGKPMKTRWDILAWQKIRYPKPYKGE